MAGVLQQLWGECGSSMVMSNLDAGSSVALRLCCQGGWGLCQVCAVSGSYLMMRACAEARELAVVAHDGDRSAVACTRHQLVVQPSPAHLLPPQHLVQLTLTVEELAQLAPVRRRPGGCHGALSTRTAGERGASHPRLPLEP